MLTQLFSRTPCFYYWGVLLFSFHSVTELGGEGGLGPSPDHGGHFETNTLGSEMGVGQPGSQSQLLGELKQHTPTHGYKIHSTPQWGFNPAFVSSQRTPLFIGARMLAALKKCSHRRCCWPDPVFLFSLHICESCVHLLNNQIQGTHQGLDLWRQGSSGISRFVPFPSRCQSGIRPLGGSTSGAGVVQSLKCQ